MHAKEIYYRHSRVRQKFNKQFIYLLQFCHFIASCSYAAEAEVCPINHFLHSILHHISVARRWFYCYCCQQYYYHAWCWAELSWARQIELNNDWVNNRITAIKLCAHTIAKGNVFVSVCGCFAGETISQQLIAYMCKKPAKYSVFSRVVWLDKRNRNVSNCLFTWRV